MSSCLPFARLILVAGLLGLSLSACGRRGALEAPPSPSAQKGTQAAQPGQQAGETEPGAPPAGTLPAPVGTPRRSAKQGYTIPKEPFILDPLL